MIVKANKRPATRHDVIDFFGRLPERTIRATVWEVDGKVVGIIGYWLVDGEAVVFSDIDPAIAKTAPAIQIWREAKAFMADLKYNAKCVATNGSERLLKSLGWVHVGTSDEGEIFEWETRLQP